MRIFLRSNSPWHAANEYMNGLSAVPAKGTDLSVQRAWNAIAIGSTRAKEMAQLCDAPGSLCATALSFTRCTWNLKPPR